jgi:hypothetical protein
LTCGHTRAYFSYPHTKLDMEPAANEQDTRVNVLKAMQSHVRGKAVYVGLFRRPR